MVCESGEFHLPLIFRVDYSICDYHFPLSYRTSSYMEECTERLEAKIEGLFFCAGDELNYHCSQLVKLIRWRCWQRFFSHFMDSVPFLWFAHCVNKWLTNMLKCLISLDNSNGIPFQGRYSDFYHSLSWMHKNSFQLSVLGVLHVIEKLLRRLSQCGDINSVFFAYKITDCFSRSSTEDSHGLWYFKKSINGIESARMQIDTCKTVIIDR